MIGRVEIIEILGMAGTCAVLLFAGFSVETLGGVALPAGVVAAEVSAPEIPAPLSLPYETHLERPVLVRPLHPAPPDISFLELPESVGHRDLYQCREKIR